MLGSLRRPGLPPPGGGGDIIVNPRNGCEILDEYVYLTLWMTTNCGKSSGSNSTSNPVRDVSVPDANHRFEAPPTDSASGRPGLAATREARNNRQRRLPNCEAALRRFG